MTARAHRLSAPLFLIASLSIGLIACDDPAQPEPFANQLDHRSAAAQALRAGEAQPSGEVLPSNGPQPAPQRGPEEAAVEAVLAAPPTIPPVELEVVELEPAEPETPEAPTLGPDDQGRITVQSGESLHLYGLWSGLKVSDIAEANSMRASDPLDRGDRLKMPMSAEQVDRFIAARTRFAEKRLKKFLNRRGGLVRVGTHTIARGESVSAVAHKNGRLPLWVMEHYNPGRDLDRLSIGDEIKLPVLAGKKGKRGQAAAQKAKPRAVALRGTGLDEDAPR